MSSLNAEGRIAEKLRDLAHKNFERRPQFYNIWDCIKNYTKVAEIRYREKG